MFFCTLLCADCHTLCRLMLTLAGGRSPGVTGKIAIFSQRHAGLKMAKLSPLGPRRGASLRYPEMGPQEPKAPALVGGCIMKKKFQQDLGLDGLLVATIGQPIQCDPPSPTHTPPPEEPGEG